MIIILFSFNYTSVFSFFSSFFLVVYFVAVLVFVVAIDSLSFAFLFKYIRGINFSENDLR